MKLHHRKLSRFFPAYHPKAGQPTFFAEKFYNSIYQQDGDWSRAPGDTSNYVVELNHSLCMEEFKHTTIRAGHHVKAGDKVRFSVWSGKPYNSKQIVIAPDIEVKSVWHFEIKMTPGYGMRLWINGFIIDTEGELKVCDNDGLSKRDFLDWFQFPKSFDGQIICWNENIKY